MNDSHDSHDRQPHGPLRVLCVDDNADAADSLGEMLSLAGHEVVVCHDGADALAAVDGGFDPDVAVLDINMPGIDGCQLASALREDRGQDNLLLVAVTALGDYRSLERMADSGFDLHFTKPVLPESIFDVLGERAAQLAETAWRR
jgi:two-component system OmpR family response regulator